MDKAAFRDLFVRALANAIEVAERRLGLALKGSCAIELHGCGSAGAVWSVEAALDKLYIDADHFYRIIDVAVKRASPAEIRVSGHQPCPFSQTWEPAELGPFKLVGPIEFSYESE